MEAIAQHLVTLLLCWGFACAGAAVMRRAPDGLLEWNRSFVVGLSAVSTALFPLSLVFHRNAVAVVSASLWASGLLWFLHYRPSAKRQSLWRRPEGIAESAGIAVLFLSVLVFGYLNMCLPRAWDGFVIWETKAMLLHEQGRLTPELWDESPTSSDTRTAQYPPMVPLFSALFSLVRGESEWSTGKPVFTAFFLSMLLSVYTLARRLLPQRLAIFAAVLAALVPQQFSDSNAGGYADLPLAAVLTAALAALFDATPDSFRSPAAWMLAGLLMVKNEGMILFGAVIAVVAFLLGRRLRGYWKSALVLTITSVLRIGYIRWTHVVDREFGMDWNRAWQRVDELPGMLLPYLTSWEDWGLLWPALLAACAVLLVAGRAAERALAGGFLLSLSAYSGLFLFTNWTMKDHVQSAYTRLLYQLVAVANVLVVAGYHRLQAAGRAGKQPVEVGAARALKRAAAPRRH